ncbi:MAG TPA: nuclear transport factor 2 family protein [Thermoanaerobaculia bacterium]|nr:nuclear transport factor 2 family protein [Thermoanaerobaculia bacterium]
MKSVATGLLALWFLSANLAAGVETPPSDPNAESRAQVEAAVQSYAAALRGSVETLADLFAPEGELIQPGLDPLVGPEEIRGFLAPRVKKVRIEEATMTSRAIDLYGDEAYVWGDYSQRVAVGEQPLATFTGHFVAQWHRTQGAWKLRRMMVQPAPTAG